VPSNHEREIADIERQQFGVATTEQLRAIGLSSSAVGRRVHRDLSKRLRRTVFVDSSFAPSFEQRLLAAVLAGGEGAFGSHEAAGRMLELPASNAVPLEITTTLDRRPRLDGVRCHRSGLLLSDDVTEVRGIPVSIPARTIVDLSARFGVRQLGRIVDDALRRRLTAVAELAEMVERLGSAPGRSRKKMRIVLARRDDSVAERETVLEDFVDHALRRFGLPRPETQYVVRVNGRERRIDFCYPEPALALEPKGFGAHSPRSQFDDDALRGNELELAGFRVLEFTSAFSDWLIASQVAEALGLDQPSKPLRPLTFVEWVRRRDRLDVSGRQGDGNRPNGGYAGDGYPGCLAHSGC